MRHALAACSILAALAVIAAGCGGTKTVTVTQTVTTVRTVTKTVTTTTTAGGSSSVAAPCSNTDLDGTFTPIPGSAGAGHVSYVLLLTNTSTTPCTVAGTPAVTLLDKNGAALATHVIAVQSGQGSATAIVLPTGSAARAEARFSPDVSGPGEPQTGPCEPTASTLRVVAPVGGTVDVPIAPVTAVCEHGTLQFSAFSASP
jgi:hypothetical protein